MAGLNDVDETTPAGTASAKEGDNQLRALKAKLKEFAGVEHHYDGAHKIPSGSAAVRPAAGKAGRLYILETPSLEDELQRDTGSAWETITRNQDVIELVDHIAATVGVHGLTGAVVGTTDAQELSGKKLYSVELTGNRARIPTFDLGAVGNFWFRYSVDDSDVGFAINRLGIRDYILKLYSGGVAYNVLHEGSVIPISDGIVTPAKLSAQTAGDYLLATNAGERVTTSATYVKLKEIKIAKSGTYRIWFTLRETSGGVAAYGRVYRNDVAVGTERNASALTSFSEDIGGWVAGDRIQVWGKQGSSGECGIQALNVCGETPGDFGINTSY